MRAKVNRQKLESTEKVSDDDQSGPGNTEDGKEGGTKKTTEGSKRQK